MADSFFGFDTSSSNLNERDDGGGREASEDEYDALNDETFGGSGEDGDWEQQHEELSMLTEVDKHHSDLEAFLSHLVLEEYDEYSSEATSPVPPPPQQHNVPNLAQAPPPSWLKNACTVEELERNMRQNQPPPNSHPHPPPLQHNPLLGGKVPPALALVPPQLQKLQQQKLQQQNSMQNMGQQNMGQQNMMQNLQQIQHQGMPMLMPFFQGRYPTGMIPSGIPPPMLGPRPPFLSGPPPPIHPFGGNFNQLPLNKMPPGLLQRPQHTVTNLQQLEQQQQQNNIHHNNMNQPINNANQPMNNMNQPGLNTMNNMNQPGLNNMNNMNQSGLNSMNNMNQPGLNNMNNMNQSGLNNMNNMNQPGLNNMNQPMNHMNQPINNMIPPINNMNNKMQMVNQQQPMNKNMNQHNMVGHPMLILQNQLNNQRPNMPTMNFKHQPNNGQPMMMMNHNNPMKKPNGRSDERVFSQEEVMQIIQETHPLLQKSNMQKFGRQKRPEDFMGNNNQAIQRRGDGDQYSGLMSQREKQWLLNIQLMQLNTGTPYMDDYYYTVFLDRQAKKEKQLEMKEAHKANQQNHPFSQQNLTNNRFNHGANAASGEGGRERRNSSRSTGDAANSAKDGPRHYVPAQFENSLGKLQCGSVTAPRKIMDMEVVADPVGGPGASPAAPGASRSTRQTLLAIEALYRCLLRVEDLEEPRAIANALVLKEREEKQRALLLEQQIDEDPPSAEPANHFLRGIESIVKRQDKDSAIAGNTANSTSASHNASSTSIGSLGGGTSNLLDENKTELLGKLLAGLLYEDRLAAFLMVRKGKMLVIRVLAVAHPAEWWRAPLGRLWPRLLRCLPAACRRDPLCLQPLVQHFRSYLNGTEGWAPVSDLCTVLTEGVNQPPPTLRANTPLVQRSLMHYIISTQLGLTLLVALIERAVSLPRPFPAAWTALVRAAAKQALARSADDGPHACAAHPLRALPPAALTPHFAQAALTQPEEEALTFLLVDPDC